MNKFKYNISRITCKMSLFFIVLSLMIFGMVDKSSPQYVILVLTLIINIVIVAFIVVRTYMQNKAINK